MTRLSSEGTAVLGQKEMRKVGKLLAQEDHVPSPSVTLPQTVIVALEKARYKQAVDLYCPTL